MIIYEYETDLKRFNKRKKSDLQHKLRVALKCYTIINFNLNDDNTFTFNAKFRDYRTKIVFLPKDKNGQPKIYTGKYTQEQFRQGALKIKLEIGAQTKDE